MATLTEHVELIKAAIEAARGDGFAVGLDYEMNSYAGDVLEEVSLYILEPGEGWENIMTLDVP